MIDQPRLRERAMSLIRSMAWPLIVEITPGNRTKIGLESIRWHPRLGYIAPPRRIIAIPKSHCGLPRRAGQQLFVVNKMSAPVIRHLLRRQLLLPWYLGQTVRVRVMIVFMVRGRLRIKIRIRVRVGVTYWHLHLTLEQNCRRSKCRTFERAIQ